MKMPKKLEQYSNFRYVDAERKLAVCGRDHPFLAGTGFKELLKREKFHAIAIGVQKQIKIPATFVGKKIESFYEDMTGERVQREIFEVIEEIHSRLRKGKVIIACPAGIFTSAVIAASYLAAKKGYTIEKAVNAVSISGTLKPRMVECVKHSVQKYSEYKALRKQRRLAFLKKFVPKWGWFRRKPKPK